ncbi:glyoxalase [Turicibacter sanguinis]|uniref:VOC family protein n=1 Tax=Turicibacter TaxID=191303 RepID=UPI0001FD8912|nr:MULTISPECIES: VOC family protein [Turicibacter]EGC90706.1 glyoxalase family protein [Turicibacter sp. HGF1]MDB8542065.1 VOC family protein [Turicibacter sanguinis]MDB8557929.1 VOC family protein [Turicibacter sanguinis]MDB8560703.1 VOC family protein [Turicibacter sanguinis]MDB8562491.1 VOC family protein [Turicibacter sanguinis]
MKINHMAMYVRQLEEMKRFYMQFFEATCGDKYHNQKTGLQTYFLTFENQMRLELMTRSNLERDQKSLYQTGYIHLAFSVGSKEKVDELTNCLKEAGYDILSSPRTTGDGYYESCILDPEGNQVEITI